MVAVIKVGSSIRRMIQYNENKVSQGNALIIGSGSYPAEASKLSFNARLNRMERQVGLNRNVQRNSLHISLNFDPSEKDMPSDKMAAIATSYMDRIGFSLQPYLIYRHFDAGHPHLHLVTTNIRSDGSRIDLHHLAIRKSEPARITLEKEYGLVNAKGHGKDKKAERQSAAKALYGKSQTRLAIQNVLENVLEKYRYTSLSQLNAVLELYNVKADKGAEGSRVSRYGGLLYRILDEKSVPIGVPIKASLLYSRPTLGRLETKFARNAIVSPALKARIRNAVDSLESKGNKPGFNEMDNHLAQLGIAVVKRLNEKGMLYGITYVDHTTGGVFNGSDLGKVYSAKAMQERFPSTAPLQEASFTAGQKGHADTLRELATNIRESQPEAAGLITDITAVLEKLMRVEYVSGFAPGIKKSRKKKRKNKGRPGSL
jgi:hypothetical protein